MVTRVARASNGCHGCNQDTTMTVGHNCTKTLFEVKLNCNCRLKTNVRLSRPFDGGSRKEQCLRQQASVLWSGAPFSRRAIGRTTCRPT